MPRTITPELRAVLEEDHRLCAEIPAEISGCRAWVTVGAGFQGDALSVFGVTHFEFRIEWMEREYDPSGDELPVFEVQRFRTEAELNAHLLRILPESANLIRVADDPDYPM